MAKIITKAVYDIETGKLLEEESYEYFGDVALCDRALSSQAQDTAKTAGTAAGQGGAVAGGIGANLIPYYTQQMQHPQGESQRDIGAQVTARLAGTGGATAGLYGAANKMGATTRNPMGFSSALDAASRNAAKGNAAAGEDVAAENAKVKLGQQADASKGLAGLYGVNLESQEKNLSNRNDAIANAIKAQTVGWLQDQNQTLEAFGDLASGAGKLISGAKG